MKPFIAVFLVVLLNLHIILIKHVLLCKCFACLFLRIFFKCCIGPNKSRQHWKTWMDFAI